MERRTLTELAREVERQKDSRLDLVASTSSLHLAATEVGSVELLVGYEADRQNFSPRSHFHAQVGERVGIPKKYYDRMLAEAPGLLTQNVNHWWEENPEKRLVRTMDGDARAFLSDRFRPIDNWEVLEAVLPVIADFPVEIMGSEVTERKLYLKVAFPSVQGEIVKGDPVQAGIIVRNSEIGVGRFDISAFVLRLVCTNGMVGESIVGRSHLGRVLDDIESARESWSVFRPETQIAVNQALVLQTQDIVRDALEGRWFDDQVKALQETAGMSVITEERGVEEVIEVVTTNHLLTKGERGSVLEHLIGGGDLSAWGLANAVTRTAQDVEDYDRSVELESIGFKIASNPMKALAA